MVTRADVEASERRIRPHVRRTPVTSAGDVLAGRVWFKLELLQHSGTFKARGAFDRQLSARDRG